MSMASHLREQSDNEGWSGMRAYGGGRTGGLILFNWYLYALIKSQDHLKG